MHTIAYMQKWLVGNFHFFAFRIDLVIVHVKSQMQMVSDETVSDQKIFNEKFSHSWRLVKEKQEQSYAHFEEGKRLLGW